MEENIWFNDQITPAMIEAEIQVQLNDYRRRNPDRRHSSRPCRVKLQTDAIRRLNERIMLAMFASSTTYESKYTMFGERLQRSTAEAKSEVRVPSTSDESIVRLVPTASNWAEMAPIHPPGSLPTAGCLLPGCKVES